VFDSRRFHARRSSSFRCPRVDREGGLRVVVVGSRRGVALDVPDPYLLRGENRMKSDRDQNLSSVSNERFQRE
jgi:hypothetical protein